MAGQTVQLPAGVTHDRRKDPERRSPQRDEGHDFLAGLLPTTAVVLLLSLLAVALVRPQATAVWLAIAVIASVAAGWVAALQPRDRSRAAAAPSAAEKLQRENERLADLAWELRESEERYRSLIDAVGDVVIGRDADGRVTFVNPAFTTAFGLAPGDVLGRVLPLGPRRPRQQPEPVAEDVRLETQAGPRWFSWVDIPVRDERGALGATYAVARDITARKQSEHALDEARQRAEAASDAKSRLLATVSHEFRTPLNGILGLSALLNESGLTADQQTYARAIQSSGEALLSLVDDMLDYSSIEAGRLDLRPEPCDLATLAQGIAELLAARAHERHLDLAVDVDPHLPPVAVDAGRLRQILINLVGNGIKFTDEGGVSLAVAPALSAGDGKDRVGVRFAVADTGTGLAPDDIERLFGEFEQSDKTRHRRHGGAGLGLAISRRLVRTMGGDIEVSAEAGGGACFTFTLDLPVAGDATDNLPRLDGTRLMLVAPDRAEAAVVRRQLERAGADVRAESAVAAAAGLTGAAVAAGQPYHAVLVDSRVAGGGGGGAALTRLREAAGERTPAIVILRPRERRAPEVLRQAGFDAYLVRPVRRASLLRIVDGIMRSPEDILRDPVDDAQAEPAAPAPGEGLEVLIAEDNEVNALLTRAVMERLGHTVAEVRDGAAAVAAVGGRERPFGAILMDLHMPELDGLDATRAIRAMEAERGWLPTPILALTADVLPATRKTAEAAGITAVLAKPMTPDSLRRALAALVPQGGGLADSGPVH